MAGVDKLTLGAANAFAIKKVEEAGGMTNEGVAALVKDTVGVEMTAYLDKYEFGKIHFDAEGTAGIAEWKKQKVNIGSGTVFDVTAEGVSVNILATYSDGTTAILISPLDNTTASFVAENDIAYIGLYYYATGKVSVSISWETDIDKSINQINNKINTISFDNIYNTPPTIIDEISTQANATVVNNEGVINLEITDTSTYSGIYFFYTVPSELTEDLYISFENENLENNEASYLLFYLLRHGELTSSTQISTIYLNGINTAIIPLSKLQELSLLGKEIKIAFTTNKITYMNIKNICVSIGEVISLSKKLELIGYGDERYNLMTLGDSITALGTGTRGWVKYFMEKINCNLVVNTGVVSAVWTDYEDTVLDGNPMTSTQTTNTLCNQVYKIINGDYDTPDIIVIAIGTNGGIDKELTYETIDATYYDSENVLIDVDTVDRTTTTGAFRYANEKLHEKYPNALIFWCVPIEACESIRSALNSALYEETIKKLTTYASVGFIDTNHCGINGLNEIADENGEYLIDGLHPNVNGAKKIGYYNAMKVKPYLSTLFVEE